MKKNMGGLDKGIRIIATIIIALLYFFNVINGPVAITLMLVAIVLILTSFMNFCPLYTVIGLSTRSKIKTSN
jgi:hypothetical protein